MSSLLNKAKDKIEQIADRNSNSNQANNPHSSNAGPHSSNLMNKGDPRVDSDRDHRNDPTSRVGGVGSTQEYNTIHGGATTHDRTTTHGGIGGVGGVEPGYGHTTGTTVGHSGTAGGLGGVASGGYSGADNPQSATVGPHRSNLANKLDPRVDSDVDNRGNPTSRVGGYGGQGETYGHSTGAPVGHTSTGITGSHGGSHIPGTTGAHGGQHLPGTTGGYGDHTSVGHTGPSTTYDNPQSANVGPHRSNLMNKVDPRVDSDVDNRGDPTSRVGGYGGQGENYGHGAGAPVGHSTVGAGGLHGGQHVPGTTGGYGSGAHVGSHGHSSATPGSGTATNTAGPHNSDLLNKLDPRVDADMDGSKTYGGNATYR